MLVNPFSLSLVTIEISIRKKLYASSEDTDHAVYVVPVFEILKGHRCPDDKAQIKDAQRVTKEVRPFHNAVRT